ncbi:MAG TPA: hypothetical protein VFS02_15920 [Telluria sp.]|nr:hypothetical protein [Telluria sp.]
MDRPVKAALISALVFPGAGHLYLKRGARACVFLLPTLAAVMVFVNDAMDQANLIVDQIMSGRMPADPAAIAAQLDKPGGGSTLATVAAAVMIICWIGATVDAYLLAKRS